MSAHLTEKDSLTPIARFFPSTVGPSDGPANDGARGVAGTPRAGNPVGGGRQSSYASSGGQAQTRLRSPYAWSMRRTGTQYLPSRSECTG